MFTIDANVWISAELPNESEHRASLAFLDGVARANAIIVLPTLLLVEAAASISRVRRDSALSLFILRATYRNSIRAMGRP